MFQVWGMLTDRLPVGTFCVHPEASPIRSGSVRNSQSRSKSILVEQSAGAASSAANMAKVHLDRIMASLVANAIELYRIYIIILIERRQQCRRDANHSRNAENIDHGRRCVHI